MNDYFIANEEGREEVKEMKVGEKLKSITRPLEVELWTTVEEEEEEETREDRLLTGRNGGVYKLVGEKRRGRQLDGDEKQNK